MRRLWILLAFCLVVLTGPVQAQDEISLSNLEISLWPEFDRPEVLMIYRGFLEADTPLPVPVELRIPARVGQPTAVAFVGDDGQPYNQQYTTRVDGDWLVVAFDLASQGFQLEYYDGLSANEGGRREYTFDYRADYETARLALELQVPPTAEGYSLQPPADSVITQSDGLEYHLVDAGAVAQGDELSWTFSYQKDNADLTVSAFAPPESEGSGAPPAVQGNDNSTVWIFLVAFVALVGVGAVAYWLGQRTQSEQPVSQPPRRQKRRGSGRGGQAGPPPTSPGSGVLFCHQCGTELRSDSDFCHRCGTPIRES